jgi:hypothetical protein
MSSTTTRVPRKAAAPQTFLGTDRRAVDGATQFRRQAGRGAVAHALLLAVQEQDRAAHAGCLPLDEPNDVLQDGAERRPTGDPFQDLALAGVEGADLVGSAGATHLLCLSGAAAKPGTGPDSGTADRQMQAPAP